MAGKRGPTRLRFALLLKFYGLEGHFDLDLAGLPSEVIKYVAQQVGVNDGIVAEERSERTGRFHQAQIREHYGFRECSTEDADRAVAWLATNVCERERGNAAVRSELLAWFRREQVEPPTSGRIERLVRSALHRGELAVTARVASRLPASVRERLDDLIAVPDDLAGPNEDLGSAWSLILAEPGDVSLNTMLIEIEKLNAVRFVGLSTDVVDDVAPAVVERVGFLCGPCGAARGPR